MPRAEEYQHVTPELAVWQYYEPQVKCDLTSAAIRAGDDLIFIDPIPLAPDALEELTATARPRLIIATNGNHARAAAEFRDRFGIPLAAHSEAAAALEIRVDQLLCEGDAAGPLTVVELPGGGPGEVALLSCGGVICVGDALIHLESHGFSMLPEKYCADPKILRRSLQKLLRLPWQVMTFAHGLPLVVQPRQKLEQLLA
jgi:hypothetical protein